MIPRTPSWANAWRHATGRWAAWVYLAVALCHCSAQAESITLHTRWRTGSTNLSAATPHDGTVTWDAARTAVVVCDMWDQHHCPDATERVARWPRP